MYIVMEIQKTDAQTVAQLVTTHATREEAEQKYHLVLSAAAVSAVPVHAAVMLSDEGNTVRSEKYAHSGSTLAAEASGEE